MTIASRLLLGRRFRPGGRERNPTPDPDPPDDESSSRALHGRHRRREDSDCPRGSSRLRHHDGRHLSRQFSHPIADLESPRLDYGAGSSGAGNPRRSELGSVMRRVGSDRLPGAVLQARERLVERLRGVSLSETRQTSTAAGIAWGELLMITGNLNLSDSRNWEAETQTDSSKRNPTPGVICELLSTFREVYRDTTAEGEEIPRTPLECCICLEKFQGGENLIRLHCRHRFHPSCLEPWVRSCRHCPYCRASVLS